MTRPPFIRYYKREICARAIAVGRVDIGRVPGHRRIDIIEAAGLDQRDSAQRLFGGTAVESDSRLEPGPAEQVYERFRRHQ
jgi:hypothetical protein